MPRTSSGHSYKRAASNRPAPESAAGVRHGRPPVPHTAGRYRATGPIASARDVDHRRRAGRVRGVPCFNCNPAIGKLGDDPDALRRAIAYLEGNAWKPTLVAPGVYQLPS
ncbi:endonuclease domain-containing protein [Streptomyces sp. A0958]|uniref:endonuclease domain-containing protein n=1 Tax=Streptomyces sp. A0958 TaxID=2563101 RepID=UPI0023EF4F34|nr:endonuclease domain-containing protein [Streptomyces sp. A0958]